MPGALKHNRRDEFAKKIVVAFFAMALVFSAALGSFAPVTNAQSTDPVDTAVANPTPPEPGDGAGNSNWMNEIGLFLGNMLLTVGATVVFLGGSMLDLTITHLILKMGTYLTQGGVGQVINDTWSIVRDVVNLVFIFGFVYIGIMTILDPGRLNTRSLLVQLIIAALLINFSLFFTKIVVDVANVFALEVNQLMDRGEDGKIGATFASSMGISKWYSAEIPPATLQQMGDGGVPTFFIMGSIFLIITGFVFAAGAVMLAIRFVALIFIMIGSPLYFAGMAFPQAKKFTFDIMGKLIGYAFYAPVFLFLIYISLRIVESSMFGGATENQLANLMENSGEKPLDAYRIFIQFLVAIILIIASLRVAKSFSMVGADAVINTTQKAIGGATAGMVAWGGRRTLGSLGLGLTKSKTLRKWAARGDKFSEAVLWAGKKTSEASFDPRRVGGMGKKLGIGEGKKGGRAQTVKDFVKTKQEIAEMIGEPTDTEIDQFVKDELAHLESAKQQLNTARIEYRKKQQPILNQIRIAARDANDNNLSQQQRLAAQNEKDRFQAELQTIANTYEPLIDTLNNQQKNAQATLENARKAAKHKFKNEYAESISPKNFWSDIPRWSMGRSQKNRAAAASIRKEFSKGDHDRLLEAIKGIKIEDGDKS